MIAFTFPGQGSQHPQMGAPWVRHPSWELVQEAEAATQRDVAQLLLEADADELQQTRNAQLATFVLSAVVLDALERTGLAPAAVAGHSLGEYSALVASGAIAFEDGAVLVAERGEAMQQAAEAQRGTMAAVLGLGDDEVDTVCGGADDVWVANYNAPGQVVIAGIPAAIDSVVADLKEAGAKKVLPLTVGGAFHTPLMAPAQDRLVKAISATEIRSSDLDVFANVDASPQRDGACWRDLLARQLCAPVRWRQTLYAMGDADISTFIELGPGAALTGMVSRTLRGARHLSISTPDDLDEVIEALATDGPAEVGLIEGEHLFATERMVVSPAAGIFEPDPALIAGVPIQARAVVGSVAETAVRSPFAGVVIGVLAHAGERVAPSQPIAWLRTA